MYFWYGNNEGSSRTYGAELGFYELNANQIIYFKKKIASLDVNFKKGNDNFWKSAERIIIEFIKPEFLG